MSTWRRCTAMRPKAMRPRDSTRRCSIRRSRQGVAEQRRVAGPLGGAANNQACQYDVTRDGRFVINTVLDDAAAVHYAHSELAARREDAAYPPQRISNGKRARDDQSVRERNLQAVRSFQPVELG